MRRELSEEDEFGMNRPGSFESDPVETEASASAVKDHPDFAFLATPVLRELMERTGDVAGDALWLRALPVEHDAAQWTFLEVRIRPDRAWLVMQELVATVCIAHGMVLADETPSSVLFRKKVGQDSMAHGMMDAATYQNLYVSIDVLPSKLRALHIGYIVSNEQKLLGGVATSHFSSVSSDRMKVLNRSMDNLLAALQSTLTSQFLTASYLYMTTPENTVEDPGLGADTVALDKGYISDVRKTFLREMKANMRDLCIPLEEYAHQEEYACALLLNLLDPLLKKHGIDFNAAPSSGKQPATASPDTSASEATSADAPAEVSTNGEMTPAAKSTNDTSEDSRDRALSKGKPYGELITEMVQELWATYKVECESKVKQKIEEKQNQVSARVQAVQRLRARALAAIVDHPEAAVTSLKQSTQGTRDDVLLYDGSCVVNNAPVRLNITYGSIIYRSMVPLFARTTIVPFADVVQIAQSSMLGIRVVNLTLNSNHAKGLTIATGLEVDLLYQLLLEILDSHKRDRSTSTSSARRSSSSASQGPPVELNSPDLEALIGAQEEEEEKENDADKSVMDPTLQKLIDEADAK